MSNIDVLRKLIGNNDITLDVFDDRRNHDFTIVTNQQAIMHALVELLERVTPQDVVAQAIRTCEQVTGKPVGPVIPQTPRQPTEPGPLPPIQSSDGPQS